MIRKTSNPSILRATLRAILPEMLLLVAAILTLSMVLFAPLAFAEDTAVGTSLSAEEVELWDAFTHGELIRLHVLADSDDAEAQRIKLAVRDALLLAFGEQLEQAGACDSDAVYNLLKENTESMRDVAAHCARNNGFDGAVTAEIGSLLLPAKSYGRVTLPAGKYRALRVTLGDGAGQNWWCVLFPQLCLAVASEEPWQTATESKIVWDASQIFRCWTAVGL